MAQRRAGRATLSPFLYWMDQAAVYKPETIQQSYIGLHEKSKGESSFTSLPSLGKLLKKHLLALGQLISTFPAWGHV